MTVVLDDLETQIDADLTEVWIELAQARLRQRAEDSPANRAAVAECRTRMDVVLDLVLETRRLRVYHQDASRLRTETSVAGPRPGDGWRVR